MIGQNATENNEMGSFIPVHVGRLETITSVAQAANDNKGLSDQEKIEAINKEIRGRDPQGETYVKGWVYGSAALGTLVIAPEAITLTALAGVGFGAGTGALSYINTIPQSEFDYQKLGIYTLGGGVTGALVTTTRNPYLMFAYGTAGTYSTDFLAEGKANIYSALVSGGLGVFGTKLGSLGCNEYCQTLLIYPIETTATTIIDKSIEKVEEKYKHEEKK